MKLSEIKSLAKSTASAPFRWWFGAIDPTPLRVFERLFTLTFALYMIERFLYASEWLTDAGFHYSTFSKSWHHIDPLPLLTPLLVPIFAGIVFGASLAVMVGWRSRLMLWVLLFCSIYIQNVDVVTSFTLNKFYIVGFAVLAMGPRTITRVDNEGNVVEVQSAWAVRTLQASLMIQYFTAGTSKIFFGDWPHNPDTLWTQVQGIYCTDACAWLLRILPKEAWAVQMYSALAFECYSPLLFMFRRTRWLAIIWGFGFHMVIAATMHQLIYFSLQMVVFYVLFMPESVLKSSLSIPYCERYLLGKRPHTELAAA